MQNTRRESPSPPSHHIHHTALQGPSENSKAQGSSGELCALRHTAGTRFTRWRDQAHPTTPRPGRGLDPHIHPVGRGLDPHIHPGGAALIPIFILGELGWHTSLLRGAPGTCWLGTVSLHHPRAALHFLCISQFPSPLSPRFAFILSPFLIAVSPQSSSKLLFIGVRLPNDGVLVSAAQQDESAIRIHDIFLCFWRLWVFAAVRGLSSRAVWLLSAERRLHACSSQVL